MKVVSLKVAGVLMDIKSRAKSRQIKMIAHHAVFNMTVLYFQNDNIVGPMLSQLEQPPGVTLKQVWARKDWAELLAGLLTKGRELNSLYEIASWVSSPVSSFYDEETLDKAWLKWRQYHPNITHDKNGFEIKETLEQQLEVYDEYINTHLLQDFLIRLEGALKSIDSALAERIPNYTAVKIEVVLAIILGGVVTRVVGAGAMVVEGVAYVGEKLSLPMPSFMHRVIEFCHDFKEFAQNVKEFYHTHQRMFHKIITMAEVVIFQTRYSSKHGLGWQGPNLEDPHIREMVNSKKIIRVEQTSWLFSHSDMLEPSDDVMKNVYEDVIFDEDSGIKLGKYNVKKKR